MKYLLALLSLSIPYFADSQRLSGDLYSGVANYSGDLQSKRFTFANIGPAVGLGLSYNITNKLSVRGAASYLQLKASDKDNTAAQDIGSRNLDFQTKILEASLALQYDLFSLDERAFTPYVFAGVAAYHFNPYTYDKNNNKVLLRPLGTEGQGLPEYPEVGGIYKNKQIAIPFGIGGKFALTERVRVGAELNIRKLFTDYLDDVSTNYADSSILAAARGPLAPALAFRGSELHTGTAYPAAGSQRGNPGNKDWYYSIGFRISYLFGAGGNGGGRGKKGMGCPGNVY
jgi:opacity protein-like surface antigen